MARCAIRLALLAIVVSLNSCASLDSRRKAALPDLVIEGDEMFSSTRPLHGIAVAGDGVIYAGMMGSEIMRFAPGQEPRIYATLDPALASEMYIYDLELDADGSLFAAARKGVLRIARDGAVETVVKEDFPGRYGACGIELDGSGGFFVSYGDKIAHYDRRLEKKIVLDGSKRPANERIETIIGLELGPDGRDLYFCEKDWGRLWRLPIKENGSFGRPSIIFEDVDYGPEYIALLEGAIVVSDPSYRYFYVIDERGVRKLVVPNVRFKHYGIETIAFGSREGDRLSLFGTGYDVCAVYRIDLSGTSVINSDQAEYGGD